MNKRQFLKGLSLLIGASAASQLASTAHAVDVALAYSPQAGTLDGDGKVLSRQQLITLHAVCAQVIPATDTPGAADLDVHGFIDNQLFHCHGEDDRQRIRAALQCIEDQAQKAHGAAFAGCGAPEQLALLQALDNGQAPFDGTDTGHFRYLKYGIAFGYYTTEIGASQELRFVPYPGGFRGSVPWDTDKRDYFS